MEQQEEKVIFDSSNPYFSQEKEEINTKDRLQKAIEQVFKDEEELKILEKKIKEMFLQEQRINMIEEEIKIKKNEREELQRKLRERISSLSSSRKTCFRQNKKINTTKDGEKTIHQEKPLDMDPNDPNFFEKVYEFHSQVKQLTKNPKALKHFCTANNLSNEDVQNIIELIDRFKELKKKKR